MERKEKKKKKKKSSKKKGSKKSSKHLKISALRRLKTAFVILVFVIFSYVTMSIIYSSSENESNLRGQFHNNIGKELRKKENVNTFRKNSVFIPGKRIYNKNCKSSHIQIFTTRHKTSEEIPIAIFVGRENLHKYAYRVMNSLKTAHFFGRSSTNDRRKRFCFLFIDDNSKVEQKKVFLSKKAKRSYLKFCKKIILLRIDDETSRSYIGLKTKLSANDAGAKARRLKKLWIYFVRKLFQLPVLKDYNGDILFLEDDLIVSPDALVVLDFLSGAKSGHLAHQIRSDKPRLNNKNTAEIDYAYMYKTHFVNLGGWGGENYINANPTLFTTKSNKYVPTMGYAFNRTFYMILESNNIFSKMTLKSGHDNDHLADWSVSLTNQLYGTILEKTPIILTLSPTLSRINHFAESSLVGNSHPSIVKSSLPWHQFEEKDQLLYNNDLSCLSPYLYDWNGIPCVSIIAKDGQTFSKLSDVLSIHPWLKNSKLKLKSIFNNIKCSFQDLKRQCNLEFKNYIEDCKEKNSFLFPLGLRHNVLSLSESIIYWEKFGPSWEHYDAQRLRDNTMQ